MNVTRPQTLIFFIKDYKGYIFAVSALSILYAVFEGLNIAVLFPIINSIIKADASAGSGGGIISLLNRIIQIIPVKDAFIAACIFVIVVVILKNIFRYLYTVVSVYGSYRVW